MCMAGEKERGEEDSHGFITNNEHSALFMLTNHQNLLTPRFQDPHSLLSLVDDLALPRSTSHVDHPSAPQPCADTPPSAAGQSSSCLSVVSKAAFP